MWFLDFYVGVRLQLVQEIAQVKLVDLNCSTVEAAMNTIMGTARNMGITVKEAATA